MMTSRKQKAHTGARSVRFNQENNEKLAPVRRLQDTHAKQKELKKTNREEPSSLYNNSFTCFYSSSSPNGHNECFSLDTFCITLVLLLNK